MKKIVTIIYLLLVVIMILFPPVKWTLKKDLTKNFSYINISEDKLHSYTDLFSALSDNVDYLEYFKNNAGEYLEFTVKNPKIDWIKYILPMVFVSIIFFLVNYFSKVKNSMSKSKNRSVYDNNFSEKSVNQNVSIIPKKSSNLSYGKISIALILILILAILVLRVINVIDEHSNLAKIETKDTVVPKSQEEVGPSKSEIERELYYLVSRLPYDDYRYNTAFFLDHDGVYKNLSITNWDIVSRLPSTMDGDQKMQHYSIHMGGIADSYKVIGFNDISYIGRVNFTITKDIAFAFINNKWIGKIYDDARDRTNLRKLKKKYIRFN